MLSAFLFAAPVVTGAEALAEALEPAAPDEAVGVLAALVLDEAMDCMVVGLEAGVDEVLEATETGVVAGVMEVVQVVVGLTVGTTVDVVSSQVCEGVGVGVVVVVGPGVTTVAVEVLAPEPP